MNRGANGGKVEAPRLSNIMAQLRDKRILGKILRRQLRMLLNVDDYAIRSISEDGKMHRLFYSIPLQDLHSIRSSFIAG